jgi:UDP-glucose 4-epimerase
MGREIEPEFQAPRAINPVPRRLAEVERTKRLIGFEAEIPLDKGLRNLVSWWRGRKAK